MSSQINKSKKKKIKLYYASQLLSKSNFVCLIIESTKKIKQTLNQY